MTPDRSDTVKVAAREGQTPSARVPVGTEGNLRRSQYPKCAQESEKLGPSPRKEASKAGTRGRFEAGGVVERDEAIADAVFDVVGRQFAQIAIERLDAAQKAQAVMRCCESFDPKPRAQLDALIRFRWASATRSKPAEGAGGLKIASATAR
jgi:hypothetical protein